MAGEPELTIKVRCYNMPGNTFNMAGRAEQHITADGDRRMWRDVELGIQRGKEVIDSVPGDAKDPEFTAILRVGQLPSGAPNFLGPYAHGTPEDRFLYLSWSGIDAGTENRPRTMFRRGKIILRHLTMAQVMKAIEAGRPIVVRLPATGRDGGPACAAIKKEAQWDLL